MWNKSFIELYLITHFLKRHISWRNDLWTLRLSCIQSFFISFSFYASSKYSKLQLYHDKQEWTCDSKKYNLIVSNGCKIFSFISQTTISEQGQYIPYNDVFLLNNTTSMNATNEWCCKLTCSRDAQCAAYMYNKLTKQCRLSDQVKLLQLTSEVGITETTSTVSLKITEHTVILIRNQGEYFVADFLCLINISCANLQHASNYQPKVYYIYHFQVIVYNLSNAISTKWNCWDFDIALVPNDY